MTRCKFSDDQFDLESRKYTQYKCEEDALVSGLCIFHDDNYLNVQDDDLRNGRRKKVGDRLEEKIKESLFFDKPLICIGYHLPHIEITNKEFKKPVYFTSSKTEQADFYGTKFLHGAEFSKAEFITPNFYDVEFIQKAYFKKAKFIGPTDFSRVKFHNEARFSLATFLGQVDFTDAKFLSTANFNYTKFCDKTNFSTAKFSDIAYFSADFIGETIFNNTTFEQEKKILFDSNLSRVSFMNSDIMQVRFSNKVVWGGKDGFEVIDEEKLREVSNNSFDWNKIPNSGKDSSKLKGLLGQIGVKWKGNLEFIKVHDSICIKPASGPFFLETQEITDIADTKGCCVADKKQNNIQSLLLVLDQINMNAVLKINDREFYRFIVKAHKNDLSLYPSKDISLGSVRDIYRNLRENYEYRARYEQASHFFIKEMELKRKYRESKSGSQIKENCWGRQNLLLTGIYYNLFGYGESLQKLAITSICFFGVFAIAYWFFNFFIPYLNFGQSYSAETIIINSITTAVSDMFQIKGQGLQPIDYVIRISSLPILGILIIALKRRFERKLRH